MWYFAKRSGTELSSKQNWLQERPHDREGLSSKAGVTIGLLLVKGTRSQIRGGSICFFLGKNFLRQEGEGQGAGQGEGGVHIKMGGVIPMWGIQLGHDSQRETAVKNEVR